MTSSEPQAVHALAGQPVTAALQMVVHRAATGVDEFYWQLPKPRSLHQARIVWNWMRRQFATVPKGSKVYLEVRPRRRPSRWVLIAIGGAA